MTIAEIDIPAAPSARNARAAERQFLSHCPAMMAKCLEKTARKRRLYLKQNPHGGRPAKPRTCPMRVRDHTTAQ